MEEILHHLGCKNTVINGMNLAWNLDPLTTDWYTHTHTKLVDIYVTCVLFRKCTLNSSKFTQHKNKHQPNQRNMTRARDTGDDSKPAACCTLFFFPSRRLLWFERHSMHEVLVVKLKIPNKDLWFSNMYISVANFFLQESHQKMWRKQSGQQLQFCPRMDSLTICWYTPFVLSSSGGWSAMRRSW